MSPPGEPDVRSTLEWLNDVAEILSDTSRVGAEDELEQWVELEGRCKALAHSMMVCENLGLVSGLLREAAVAAAVLAAYSPALPDLSKSDVSSKQHYLRVLLLRLNAGCTAAQLLLCCQARAAAEALTDPSGVFRLAASANFALGYGVEAIALAQRFAAVSMPLGDQEQFTMSLAHRCDGLLAVAHRGLDLLQVLGERQPAPALCATVLKPQRLAALVATCAVVLGWCRGQLGSGWLSLTGLKEIFFHLPKSERQQLMRRSHADEEGLLPLVLAQLQALVLRLLRLPPSNAEVTLVCGELAAALAMLDPSCLLPDAGPAMEAIVAAGAAALLQLLPVLHCDAPEGLLALVVLARLSSVGQALLQLPASQHARAAAGTPPPAAPIPAIVLEITAMCSSAALAALEQGVISGPQAVDLLFNSLDDLHGLLTCLDDRLARTVLFSRSYTRPAAEAIGAATAATEALLRLAGRLRQEQRQLCLLHPAEHDGVARGVATMSGSCTKTASLLLQLLLPPPEPGPRGGSILDSSLEAVVHLATSAGKLGMLTAGLAPEAAALELGVLLLACYLLLDRCCQWSASGAAVRRALLGRRELDGVLLPLLEGLSAMLACPLSASHCPEKKELAVQFSFLLRVNKRLGALPRSPALQQQQRVLVDHARTLWSRLMGDNKDLDSNPGVPSILNMLPVIDGFCGRLSVFAVETGLLGHMVATAQAAAKAGQQWVAESLWVEVSRLGLQVQQQLGPGQDPPPAWRQWLQLQSQLMRLPARQRQQMLCMPKFWEEDMAQRMLPAARALAAAVPQPEQPSEQALRQQVSAALATRVCANPRCTNVHGSSEGRLRGRRCGGCGMVRFCSQECQVATWVEHAAVCGRRTGEGQA